MGWKDRFKRSYKARFIIIGLIFALVGWFLLFVLLFGSFFEDELATVERALQTPSFLWIFRAVIMAFTIMLIWQHKRLERLWENKPFRRTAYVFFGVGGIGWIYGLIDLIS